MLFQAVMLYLACTADDEFVEKIIVAINTISLVLFMLLALKGYIS